MLRREKKFLCIRFASVPKKPCVSKIFIGLSEISFAVFSLLSEVLLEKNCLHLVF